MTWYAFAEPAMSGDNVSVLVLAEDSQAMAAKWPDVRNAYLPVLLDRLRAADPSVNMEARWLTTSPSSPPSHRNIRDTDESHEVPNLPLGKTGSTKHSPASLSRAITLLSQVNGPQRVTKHLVLVAASGPLTHGSPNEMTPSGFDPWDDIANVLKQQYIRLHVILSIGAEMRTYHELFKRSLQLQNNSEVPTWFGVDPQRFSIRLSGRPQYVRSASAQPVMLVAPVIQDDPYRNTSPPTSSPAPVSPPSTAPSPSSPPHTASPAVTATSRRSSTSPTTSRTRPRADSSHSSPGAQESGPMLVSYLQQMHGLTKKKSYGIKAPKKTYADAPVSAAGRPILPRLDVPQSQSDIYTYPSFDPPPQPPLPAHAASDSQLPTLSSFAGRADPNQAHAATPRRHSLEQIPPAAARSGSTLVVRSGPDDRRVRLAGRGGPYSPWLPIGAPSSTPSSPTTATGSNPGTMAALQSLATMTPRLPDFVTAQGSGMGMGMSMGMSMGMDRPLAPHQPLHGAGAGPPLAAGFPVGTPVTVGPVQAYPGVTSPAWMRNGNVQAQVQAQAQPMSAASPTHARFQPSPTASGLSASSPRSSSASAAAAVAAAAAAAAAEAEDQPFLVSPEYVADVQARFMESVRSGEMQASMTPAIHAA
ncbi:uncharacterized protein BXZ73DRAFT_43279, partial [Epithele typhae]|uniref:uncharacterized protein n=1 Tax=Epithele typhae TaxID=378194 RepID=UPI002007D949